MNKNLNYEDIIHGIDNKLLLQTTERPDSNGALSRNKEGYFSVRFQMGMSKLADIAIRNKRTDALQEYIKTLEYAFDHQNPDGSYKLILPKNVTNVPAIDAPTKGDSVSAIAFFGYSLGISLNAIEESGWFVNKNDIPQIKHDLESYRSNIDKTLTYLMDHENILRQTDADAPNRLLFDAIAFYTLGKYTGNTKAQSLGIDFLNLALSSTNREEGYFIENGGWDSSYNGVAVKLGLELFSILPATHSSKDLLARRLACATKWQESRILASGEISTDGNTRVYPGGESFLGTEKEVDVEKTIRTFYYSSILTDNKKYKKLAAGVLDYYR
ncbi:hypothetical protein [Fodinibius halophilus]|uniref:Uncharacterized protein n=1 Tax=Fodinibius halophilus TaxID=1736908 RepID=A0A6M1SWU9_9BACT|nr:hypothetical protein [Fodinibius halophilus]NGP88036.1 hypothetical protein [Fodinibius halophilus]